MLDVFTEPVTKGMAALLQSSVEWVEWSSEVKVYYYRNLVLVQVLTIWPKYDVHNKQS